MNTETIVHPRLQHIALATGNMDAMIAWYRTVVGMNINHRRAAKPDPSYKGPPFGAAWISNDEVHQRIALFEFPGLAVDSDKQRHTHMHHRHARGPRGQWTVLPARYSNPVVHFEMPAD